MFQFSCPLLLFFHSWYPLAVKKFYPNSKYTLTADELPLTAVLLECRRIFLQGFTVGVARLQRGHNKRSKKTTTKVVILSHKLNMKVLSPCYTALLCNSVWSILALSWRSCLSQSVHHSPGLKTLRCEHPMSSVLGLFLVGMAGFLSLCHFPPCMLATPFCSIVLHMQTELE